MKPRYAIHVDGFRALTDSDRIRAERVMLAMSLSAGVTARLIDMEKGRVVATRVAS